jgi:hypothetical protein
MSKEIMAPALFVTVASKAIHNGASATSDTVDIREFRGPISLEISITGGASHDGTASLCRIIPCDPDGNVPSSTTYLPFIDLSLETASAAEKITMLLITRIVANFAGLGGSGFMTEVVTPIPFTHLKVFVQNMDADKDCTINWIRLRSVR